MKDSDIRRVVAASRAIVAGLGLEADDAVVLNNSNKLIVRLLPCDVVARVAWAGEHVEWEVDRARQLAERGSPVAALDPRVEPRVYERDGFVATLWTYYEPGPEVPPVEYADALVRLHAGMRAVDVPAPNFLRRVDEAQQLVASRDLTPDLVDGDREFLDTTLRAVRRAVVGRGAPEQLLHGEPHPGNLLNTRDGPRFIDFETCCRGPVEFDLAHAPDEVSDHYPGLDQDLLRECRMLKLAMIIMWRWDRGDQLPDGRRLAAEWLGELRAALGQYPLPTS